MNLIRHLVFYGYEKNFHGLGRHLLALTATVSAGPMSVTSSKLIAPLQAWTEPVYYRCHGYYGWVPEGTIAGPTGGWPYYGWYGYPICPTDSAPTRIIVIMVTTATHTVAIMARALTDQMESSDREGIAQLQEIERPAQFETER